MKESVNPTCQNCKHWMNNQAELEYNKFSGICTSPRLKFNSARNDGVVVLDRKNPSEKFRGVNWFENRGDVVPIGKVERSRYCLVTDIDFGCINFES